MKGNGDRTVGLKAASPSELKACEKDTLMETDTWGQRVRNKSMEYILEVCDSRLTQHILCLETRNCSYSGERNGIVPVSTRVSVFVSIPFSEIMTPHNRYILRTLAEMPHPAFYGGELSTSVLLQYKGSLIRIIKREWMYIQLVLQKYLASFPSLAPSLEVYNVLNLTLVLACYFDCANSNRYLWSKN